MILADMNITSDAGVDGAAFRGSLAVVKPSRRDAMPSTTPEATHILTAPAGVVGLEATARVEVGSIVYRVLGRLNVSADLDPTVTRWRVAEETFLGL